MNGTSSESLRPKHDSREAYHISHSPQLRPDPPAPSFLALPYFHSMGIPPCRDGPELWACASTYSREFMYMERRSPETTRKRAAANRAPALSARATFAQSAAWHSACHAPFTGRYIREHHPRCAHTPIRVAYSSIRVPYLFHIPPRPPTTPPPPALARRSGPTPGLSKPRPPRAACTKNLAPAPGTKRRHDVGRATAAGRKPQHWTRKRGWTRKARGAEGAGSGVAEGGGRPWGRARAARVSHPQASVDLLPSLRCKAPHLLLLSSPLPFLCATARLVSPPPAT
jgi:hypothetical protein